MLLLHGIFLIGDFFTLSLIVKSHILTILYPMLFLELYVLPSTKLVQMYSRKHYLNLIIILDTDKLIVLILLLIILMLKI